MTVLEDVIDLIERTSPDAICDDCIARKLRLGERQHANQKTRELESDPMYDRRQDRCASCGAVKLVIRKARWA